MEERKEVEKIPKHLFPFFFRMCELFNPLKKMNAEIDFGKCLLCQSDEKSECRKLNDEIVRRVIYLANEKKILRCYY